MKDTVDPVQDEMLARFVVSSHLRAHPLFDDEVDEQRVATSWDADIIPQDMLRKYITYARDRIKPRLDALDEERLSRLYVDLRRESLNTGSYPITVRHLESMIRMAEASAKMHLRDYVRSDDIDLAIRATVESFVSAQKMSIKRTLERGFRKYIHQARDHDELLSFLLGGIVKDKMRFSQYGHRRREADAPFTITVSLAELESRAKELDIFDVRPFLLSRVFKANGYVWNESEGTIAKRFGPADER